MYLISEPGERHEDMIPLGLFSDMHQVFHFMQSSFSSYIILDDDEPSIQLYLCIMKLDQEWNGSGDCDHYINMTYKRVGSTDKSYYISIDDGPEYTLDELPNKYLDPSDVQAEEQDHKEHQEENK